jgi:hypothetical protein
MFGTLLSAGLIEIAVLKEYQMFLVSIGLVVSGVSLGLLTAVTEMRWMYALLSIQV